MSRYPEIGVAKVDAAVVADLALCATEPTTLVEDRLVAYVVPTGTDLHQIDLERYAPGPYRARGDVSFYETDDFLAYVNANGEEGRATIWQEGHDAPSFAAILNGDNGPAAPGWRDHRAVLRLQKTRSWYAWEQRDGDLMNQEAFAEFIEERALDVVTPDAATMVEISRTFEAKSTATFNQATRLKDGTVQFRFEQDVTARAGERGDFEIPDTFELALAPFEGVDPYKVTARFRYRLRDGKLSLGFALVRPEDVVRDALGTVRAQIVEGLLHGQPVYVGVPPRTER